MKNKIFNPGITSSKTVNPDYKAKEKPSTKRKYSIVSILILIVSASILASVAIPATVSYSRTSKEKIALNLAALIAQSVTVYYSQNDMYPAFGDLSIQFPTGYTATIGVTTVSVKGDGAAGYVSTTDFNTQTVVWHY